MATRLAGPNPISAMRSAHRPARGDVVRTDAVAGARASRYPDAVMVVLEERRGEHTSRTSDPQRGDRPSPDRASPQLAALRLIGERRACHRAPSARPDERRAQLLRRRPRLRDRTHAGADLRDRRCGRRLAHRRQTGALGVACAARHACSDAAPRRNRARSRRRGRSRPGAHAARPHRRRGLAPAASRHALIFAWPAAARSASSSPAARTSRGSRRCSKLYARIRPCSCT